MAWCIGTDSNWLAYIIVDQYRTWHYHSVFFLCASLCRFPLPSDIFVQNIAKWLGHIRQIRQKSVKILIICLTAGLTAHMPRCEYCNFWRQFNLCRTKFSIYTFSLSTTYRLAVFTSNNIVAHPVLPEAMCRRDGFQGRHLPITSQQEMLPESRTYHIGKFCEITKLQQPWRARHEPHHQSTIINNTTVAVYSLLYDNTSLSMAPSSYLILPRIGNGVPFDVVTL